VFRYQDVTDDVQAAFSRALAVGGIIMAVGAAIHYFTVGGAINDADLAAP
jgi:hypothetical protein